MTYCRRRAPAIRAVVAAVLACCFLAVPACRYWNPAPSEKRGTVLFSMLNKQQQRDFLKNEKQYPDEIIEDIISGRLRPGMTKEQVLYSWGRPDDVYESGGPQAVQEQWVYKRLNDKTQYVYFYNGRLTSWRDW